MSLMSYLHLLSLLVGLVRCDLPSTCLGQLARANAASSTSGAAETSGYCNPGEFVEIEFKIGFGCDVPTRIDQGVRFEVEAKDPGQNNKWMPIRFYTPPLTPANSSLLTLLPNNSVEFKSSSFPLIHLNTTGSVTIKEYLCGNYSSLIRSQTEVRLRWLQEFDTAAVANTSTWYLEDIVVRIWNGTCFELVLSEDLMSLPSSQSESDVKYNVELGQISSNICAKSGSGSALYFSGGSKKKREFRIDIKNLVHALGSCENASSYQSPTVLGPCLQGSATSPNVSLHCSPYGGTVQWGTVQCGCGIRGIAGGGVACQGDTTTTEPTTTEPPPTTTEPPPTTTEPPPTTTEPPPTTTEPLPTTTEPPSTTTEPPPTTTEPPPTTTEPPPTTTEPPPTTTEPPPTTTEPPPTTTEPPPTTTEPPPTTTEPPPTTTEPPPTTTEPPPTTTEPPPTTTEPPPTTTEPPPTTTEPPPTTTEPPPTTTEPPPTTTEPPPTTTDPPPITTEPPPTTTEPPPTTAEPPPTTTEPPPTTTEAPPTTTEAPPEAIPTITEATPTNTEAPPTTAKATPTDTEAQPANMATTTEGDASDESPVGKLLDDLSSVIDSYEGGSAPEEVNEMVIDAADEAFQEIEMGSGDSSEGGRVLALLDDFALSAFNSSFGVIETDNYTLSVKDLTASDLLTGSADRQVVAISEEEGRLSLPNELFEELFSTYQQIRVAAFLFKNLSGILPSDTVDGRNDSEIVSAVVSTTLGCGEDKCNTSMLALEKPVKIELRHFNGVKLEDRYDAFQCLFLDIERNVWSSDGCKRNETASNASFSVCECTHLTHFAILLSPGLLNATGTSKLALEIIGYVGVGISVLCMAMTVVTLTFLKALWGMRTFIHINLCVCLSIAQLLFVVAAERTEIQGLCQAIAVVLHYFFLVSFMWMLMEGVVLYVMLVRVFIKKQRDYIIGFTLVSYGLPALYMCVVVPLGLALGDEQGPHYGGPESCWLRYDTHFIWAFIGPVILIILANIGFFIMAISIMYKHSKKESKTRTANISHWLRTSISLLVVMGITWLIGVLVLHEVVAYVFVIATAFQGTFIFILFIALSKQVKESYLNWWRKKKSGSKFLSSTFSTIKITKTSAISSSNGSHATSSTLDSKFQDSTLKPLKEKDVTDSVAIENSYAMVHFAPN